MSIVTVYDISGMKVNDEILMNLYDLKKDLFLPGKFVHHSSYMNWILVLIYNSLNVCLHLKK